MMISGKFSEEGNEILIFQQYGIKEHTNKLPRPGLHPHIWASSSLELRHPPASPAPPPHGISIHKLPRRYWSMAFEKVRIVRLQTNAYSHRHNIQHRLVFM